MQRNIAPGNIFCIKVTIAEILGDFPTLRMIIYTVSQGYYIIFSKLTVETLELGLKYGQS